MWGAFTDCYVPEGGVTGESVPVALTVGAKSTGTFSLPSSQTVARLDPFGGACPNADVETSAPTSYSYVSVVNTSGMTATVSIWGSKASTAGAQDIDTIMATYAGGSVPLTDMQRKMCSVGVADYCFDDQSDPTACQSGWAGIIKGDSAPVTVPPYQSIIVYTAAYYGSGSSEPKSGDYQLTVRTESLQ